MSLGTDIQDAINTWKAKSWNKSTESKSNYVHNLPAFMYAPGKLTVLCVFKPGNRTSLRASIKTIDSRVAD